MDNSSNGWRLQQSLWEDRLERVAENDKGEGDQFCDRIYPTKRSGETLRKKQSRSPAYVDT